MKKVIVTGPESTGKTTLSKQLSAHFGIPFRPEFAREYLQIANGVYDRIDLKIIAQQQNEMDEEWAKNDYPFLILDTSFLVLKIWSTYKFGKCNSFILKGLEKEQDSLFLLCGTDIEWEFDPLRENPNNREELYAHYKKELEEGGFHFVEIMGSEQERLKHALNAVTNWQ